ncbi:MAG: nuclear transport factor 2 family protein, partial [Acidobacteriota bacterium]
MGPRSDRMFGLWLFPALALMVQLQAPQFDGGRAGLMSLVDAELSFAGAAAKEGIRAAFLAFLAHDAVVFRPQPVNGRRFFADSPSSEDSLSWYPVAADIAGSGDMGYTTGPYEFRSSRPGDGQLRHGHYVTLWRRQSDGSWRAVLDVGAANPAPEKKAEPWTPPGELHRTIDPEQVRPDSAAERSGLLRVETDFARDAESGGPNSAYADRLEDHARFIRPGRHPAVGVSAIVPLLPGAGEKWSWEPGEVFISSAADLGYCYGSLTIQAG